MPEPDNGSLFRDALLETCNWLEEHDYPMVGLFTPIKEIGAVASAKQALASANWSDGLLELWGLEEPPRSLEALVLRPEFYSLFTDEERAVAKARLDDCSPAPQTEGEAILPVFSIKRLMRGLVSGVPAQPPTSGPDPSRCNNQNAHWLIEQQERDLNSGLPLHWTSWDRLHLEGCAQCAEAHPAVVEAYRRFDSNAVKKLRDLLAVLKICLDRSWHKVELLLEQMRLLSTGPDDNESRGIDENHFETLCSQAEDNLPPLLGQRAAMVAAHVGYFISRHAGSDKLLEWREGGGPHDFADFVHRLAPDDFLNLLIADQCYRVWLGYEPVDVLEVPSYGEFRPVEGVLATEPFPFVPEAHTPSFNFGYFMDCVRDGALWRHPECIGAQYGRPELRTATPTASTDKDSPRRRRREPPLEDRGNRLEASLRKAMGGDLFGELVPQAKPSALQAEFPLQHRDCPEPSDIVFSLARAFEIQVRDGWLKGFADYLLENGVWDYPEDQKYKTVLHHGKFRGEYLTLGFELAKQIRNDWLGQSRPGEGIFQAVLPCGLPPA